MNDQYPQHDQLPKPHDELKPYPTPDESAHFYVQPEVDPLQAAASIAWRRSREWLQRYYRAVLGIAAALLVIAATALYFTDGKYVVMNVFIKADVSVTVVDASTRQPVPGAGIITDTAWARSDDSGKVALRQVPYGQLRLTVKKAGYSAEQLAVKVTSGTSRLAVSLKPNGAVVQLQLKNLATGAPLKGAKATFGDSDAISNSDGQVALSLPPQPEGKAAVTVSAAGMSAVTRTFSTILPGVRPVGLVPSGKVYFLSKASGRLDVVKSNFDGSEVQTIVTGTGREVDGQTVLIASNDWRYLILKSKRDGPEKLYLIDARNDSMQVIDDEKASFRLVGWSGQQFVYAVDRLGASTWQSKSSAIKGFNAETKALTVIDENLGRGQNATFWLQQVFVGPYMTDKGIVYAKYWDGPMARSEEQHEIITVGADGSRKQILKALRADAGTSISARRTRGNEVIFAISGRSGGTGYLAYNSGTIRDVQLTAEQFMMPYPARLRSPSGSLTIWNEVRDGKTMLIASDASGRDGRPVPGLDGYAAYGWYGNEYLLVGNSRNELFVVPRSGPPLAGALKVADYYPTAYGGQGFGYGSQ